MARKQEVVNGAAKPSPVVVEQALATVETGGELAFSISQDMYAEDAGNSFGKDDLAIPFIRSLQTGSPQVNKRDPLYIEGAEEGMFINTVTSQLWPGEPGLIMVPVAYTPSYTEWRPERKGFVKDYGADASILSKTRKNDKNEDVLIDGGNVITRAGLYYVFIYDEITGAVLQAAFSLSSTALKVSRKWNTNIQSLSIKDKSNRPFNPAMFYMSYRVATQYEENDKGNWFTYDIKPFKPTVELGIMGPDVYMAARKFKQMVTEGVVQVKHEQQQDDAAKEEVPF